MLFRASTRSEILPGTTVSNLPFPMTGSHSAALDRDHVMATKDTTKLLAKFQISIPKSIRTARCWQAGCHGSTGVGEMADTTGLPIYILLIKNSVRLKKFYQNLFDLFP